MKVLFIIKFFIVICCQQSNLNHYTYQVRDIVDSTNIGTYHTSLPYKNGDTVTVYIKK